MLANYVDAKARISKRISKDKRDKWDEAADSLAERVPAYSAHLLHAMKLELRLSIKQWRTIAQLLMTSSNRGAALCAELCQLFGRMLIEKAGPAHISSSFRKAPAGPKYPAVRSATFGRVRTRTKLVSDYAARFGHTHASAARNLRHELKTFVVGSSSINFPLGNFLMWSTLDEGGSVDPFRPRTGTVADFLAQMGIGDDGLLKHETFIFLTYRLPRGVFPHVPTILEAFAGIPNYYFRPLAIRDGDFPRTMPLPGYERLMGRPEVTHAIVYASKLTAPPERHRLTSNL